MTKAVNLEDLQISVREVFNKGFGNSGTCTTAAATPAKTVTLGTIFSLVTGCTLLVKFTHGITSENSTLAVTHTVNGSSVTETAKAIYLNGASVDPDVVPEGAILILRYNGTQYDIIGGAGNKVDWSGVAGLGEYEGTAEYPDFDAETDTVHVTPQTLTEAKKTQARANIGAEVITYNSTTNTLQKTVGSTTTDICPLGQSGFVITTDETTGTDTFTAIGGATITVDDETGTDIFTF